MSMSTNRTPFLTAQWRHLAMLNYEIDPEVLQPFVPAGTELDQWQGKTFVSVVGFLFLETRVLGIPIPFHRNFEEVNLRFYVRHKAEDGWRRAVVFIKEIVPRSAITWVANTVYGENYVTLPMSHNIVSDDSKGGSPKAVSYCWQFLGNDNKIELTLEGSPEYPEKDSEEEFITEHYWGYAQQKDGRTREYQVEHPQWRAVKATQAKLDCDVARLYGSLFVEFLQTPSSAFLADGSEVTVYKGNLLS